jgi:hypothetical protein
MAKMFVEDKQFYYLFRVHLVIFMEWNKVLFAFCLIYTVLLTAHAFSNRLNIWSTTRVPVESEESPDLSEKPASLPLEADIIIFALSGRGNFRLRNATRETWGSLLPSNVILKFVVGNPCLVAHNNRSRPMHTCETSEHTFPVDNILQTKELQLQRLLDLEQSNFGDILHVNVTDVYIFLPEKVAEALSWGYQETTAKFFMKTDDDVYMYIQNVLTLDLGDPSIPGWTGANFGALETVHRDPSGKWFQTPNGPRGWIFSGYTEFPHGQCYFVSRKLAELISRVKTDVRKLQGEDVSLGMWNYFFGGSVKSYAQLYPECRTWVQHLGSHAGHWTHHFNFLKCGKACGC